MKNDLKNDKLFLEKLSTLGIDSDAIILSSPIDLSEDGTYISGYLFVTTDKVGVCTGKLPDNYINCFKGIDTKDLEVIDPTDLEIMLYENAKLAHLRLDAYIGSNILSAEFDGKPVHIAAFTNRYQAEMNVLFRKLRVFLKEGILPSEENKDEDSDDPEVFDEEDLVEYFGFRAA